MLCASPFSLRYSFGRQTAMGRYLKGRKSHRSEKSCHSGHAPKLDREHQFYVAR